MTSRTLTLIGGTAIAAALVAGILFSLQNFDAEKVSCDGIEEARASLQSMYDAGVNASVQVYAGEKAAIDDTLSRCLSAQPVDPCDDAQKTRDAAVAGFNGISSPADSAPYAEFQTYFAKRDEAYASYKKAKDALDQCRAANPPKGTVPYEQSDSKKCFDAYDASVEAARDTFGKNTQALRGALTAAMNALDAREKACNPPTSNKDRFTDPTVAEGGDVDIQNCQMIDPNADTELFRLRKRAAALPAEIQAAQDSIDNVRKRMGPLERDLRDVDTYIPPEAAKTQFEGALNGLRAERKVSIEASLDFYNRLLARRKAEKETLEKELADVQAQIAARLSQIQKENAERQRKFPTTVHLAKPDKCAYYHCHGLLCGRPDPVSNGCGHGTTTESDVGCKEFIKAYLRTAGAN
jgi:hypothetical protein